MNSPLKQAMMIVALVICLPACVELKQAGRTVGHASRDVAKDVGHATRDAAKYVASGTKRVFAAATEPEETEKPTE